MSRVGVSGMAVYVPSPCVDLKAWCGWYGRSFDKIGSIIGRSFRMADRDESVYTMAANAVLRLIRAYDIDPRTVGFLGFGTESSTDNSAGAVIIRGMVDRALEQTGLPRLPRACEVPEVKHACLGGIYALKGALRWAATDGAGRRAIVVAADRAEYERGSSGEPTQGAGAVAMLVEADPKLFEVDLARAGGSSAYRGADFRKPFQRHFMEGYAAGTRRLHDFPVFSGPYSTNCYVDATVHAVGDMLARIGSPARDFYRSVAGVFFHRPYHHMPIAGMAALYVWGLAQTPSHLPELEALCKEAGADFETVHRQMTASPDLFDSIEQGDKDGEVYPEVMKVVRCFRRTAQFHEIVARKMSLGADRMMDIGNLYTASLPAWLAAGLEDALAEGRELVGQELVAIGYGSGDAAEAFAMRVVPGWQEAAARIGFDAALAERAELTQAQYEALHDGGEASGLEYPVSARFVVDRIGETHAPEFQDLGIEYYRYVG